MMWSSVQKTRKSGRLGPSKNGTLLQVLHSLAKLRVGDDPTVAPRQPIEANHDERHHNEQEGCRVAQKHEVHRRHQAHATMSARSRQGQLGEIPGTSDRYSADVCTGGGDASPTSDDRQCLCESEPRTLHGRPSPAILVRLLFWPPHTRTAP